MESGEISVLRGIKGKDQKIYKNLWTFELAVGSQIGCIILKGMLYLDISIGKGDGYAVN